MELVCVKKFYKNPDVVIVFWYENSKVVKKSTLH